MTQSFYTGSITSNKKNTQNIPTKLSDLTDDLGTNPTHTHSQYLTQHQDISNKQDILTEGSNINIDENNVISAIIPLNTSRFSINNSYKNYSGLPYILSYSGSTLSFQVDDGTTYEPLVATTGYSGEQFEKTNLLPIDVSSLSDGTYNVFISKTLEQPYLLNNVIIVQAERPSDTATDMIPEMTSNTTTYGTITWEYNGAPDNKKSQVDSKASYLYQCFSTPTAYAGVPDLSNGTHYRTVDFPFTYTFAENKRPQAGYYQFTYTPQTANYKAEVRSIRFNYIDGTYTEISKNTTASFTINFNAANIITSIKITARSTSSGSNTQLGAFKFLKPAIMEENTLWINNGVEPLEVKARDNNAQWQPFNDVLCGTVTVSSGVITNVQQPDFNYFSTINMHNISVTAHQDIRDDIPTLISDLIDTTSSTPIDKAKLANSASTLTNLTASVTELNTLDGITATVTELNYCDGVTSSIQSQIDALAQRISALESSGE